MMRADDVASVIISRSGPWIDAMRLQKLLYYVQAWHLAVTDEPLFPERFKAYKDGPVVPPVWHARMDRQTRRAADQDLHDVELTPEVSDLIDLVLSVYGSMSGAELSALTHVEEPWLEARNGLPDDVPSSTPLNLESMANFYRTQRRLGGRTAADIAVGGIHIGDRKAADPVDVDAILAAIADDVDERPPSDDDPWGGANLEVVSYDMDGIEQSAHRTYSEA